MVLHDMSSKGKKYSKSKWLSTKVFLPILLIHAVVMYACSWYVAHNLAVIRMSSHVTRHFGKMSLEALPVDNKKASLKTVKVITESTI
jgi:hypothetical protein